MSKKKSLVEGVLSEVLNLEKFGEEAEKVANKLREDNEENGCIGVAVIMIGKVGSARATSSDKSRLKNEDFKRVLKSQMRGLDKSLKEEKDEKEADKLFDKLQKAVDEMDDKEALIEVMTEAAISTALTGATALDGLKKVNKAAGSVLTDSELEILDKSLRKKHEIEQDDDDEE